MAIAVGINGFGRIGRLAARMLLRDPERFELRLVNDLAEPEILGRLLERDSTYGFFGTTTGSRSMDTSFGSQTSRIPPRFPGRRPASSSSSRRPASSESAETSKSISRPAHARFC